MTKSPTVGEMADTSPDFRAEFIKHIYMSFWRAPGLDRGDAIGFYACMDNTEAGQRCHRFMFDMKRGRMMSTWSTVGREQYGEWTSEQDSANNSIVRNLLDAVRRWQHDQILLAEG